MATKAEKEEVEAAMQAMMEDSFEEDLPEGWEEGEEDIPKEDSPKDDFPDDFPDDDFPEDFPDDDFPEDDIEGMDDQQGSALVRWRSLWSVFMNYYLFLGKFSENYEQKQLIYYLQTYQGKDSCGSHGQREQ